MVRKHHPSAAVNFVVNFSRGYCLINSWTCAGNIDVELINVWVCVCVFMCVFVCVFMCVFV